MEHIAELQHVTKHFGSKAAVDDVSFTIDKGSIVAVLGPNGAGKTTTISMMLGLLEPTSGSVRLFGQTPKQPQVKQRIGAMLQDVSVIDGLKVREVLALIRSYYPRPMRLEELAALAGFTEEDLGKRAEKLSGGQKRRLGFALALAGNPDLLFFDEPTVGLDTPARRSFWEQVRALSDRGKTILFSTHYLQEAEDAADRVILFNRGKIAADGTPQAITAQLTSRSVTFTTDTRSLEGHALMSADTEQHIRERLLPVPGVHDCTCQEGRWTVTADNTDTVLAAIFRYQLPVHDIRTQQGRLDDAFEIMIHNDDTQGAVS
ncbi:ABC transporter ATP-binding protein [Paenibacillus cineris]|uniref:ABC transporter ATP-binding protein n=1 Tax=Paenibacillus cineris TaxID=237530 RepID=UPI001B0D9298|nr:ABC transporter ATP-binding protein [Paenibacillus cineris]GIO61552.1 putative ABC transporter ATP-binding protein YvfR [Paenibacillus cineris]